MVTRRQMLISSAAAVATGAVIKRALAAPPSDGAAPPSGGTDKPSPGGLSVSSSPDAQAQPASTITPNGANLPWKSVDGVKVYHLTAHEFEHEFAPGLKSTVWGYNGRTPGPTLEAVEGDRVRVYVTNRLPAPTTIHWHGVLLPEGMDGVTGLTQAAIPPGQTFKYEWTFRQHGTLMYHSHYDEMTQIALGLVGMIVVHPRKLAGPPVQRDYTLMLQEWRIDVGTRRPNTNEMTEFNLLTINGKAFPATAPLLAQLNDRVRIRLGNLGPMDHHPIHLHGHYFKLVGTDGGDIPEPAQWPLTTVLVPVGGTRDILFTADNPGDWALHCHMTHHMMNQMSHGQPHLIGVDAAGFDDKVNRLLPDHMTMGTTGMGGHGLHAKHMPQPANSIAMKGMRGPYGYIDMGGMFTILRVREKGSGGTDPVWYVQPPDTQTLPATPEELRRDGINPSS